FSVVGGIGAHGGDLLLEAADGGGGGGDDGALELEEGAGGARQGGSGDLGIVDGGFEGDPAVAEGDVLLPQGIESGGAGTEAVEVSMQGISPGLLSLQRVVL